VISVEAYRDTSLQSRLELLELLQPQGFIALLPYPTDRPQTPSTCLSHQLNTLGDHLRKRRLDLGLLQREAADKLGVDAMTICNWEINRTSPPLRFIPKIITLLGYIPYDTQSGTLGKRIVACRRVMGLSQKEMARRLGVDPSTPGRWERDEARPPRNQLEVLIATLAGHLLCKVDILTTDPFSPRER